MPNTTSKEQFQATSLNNALELCYMLDKQIARLHKEESQNVKLCKQANDQLISTLMRARRDVLTTPLPNLHNEPDLSYHISMRTDMLAIGIMDFKDTAAGGRDPAHKSRSQILFRYTFPVLSVNEWAELNGVQPNTVRQWINRGRIQCIKRGKTVGISLMQYDPNTLTLDVTPPLAYAITVPLPQEIKQAFPFLNKDNLVGLRLFPKSFRKDNDQYIAAVTTNTDGKMTNEHIPIPEKTAEELKTVLADLKFESREAPMFFSPLTSDDWTLGHRLPAIAMPHPNDMSYQEFMRDYPSLGFVGRKTPEQNQPVWELLMKIENITVCKVEGVLFRTAPDPMSGATGQRQDDIPFSGYDAIEAIREDTEWSVDNGWANDTMLVTNLTFVEGFDEATMIRFLNTLPVRMYSVCRILPRRVIILPDHMGSLQTNLLDKTDYRKLDKSGVYYAYAV